MIRNTKYTILSVFSLFSLCLLLASLGMSTTSCEDEEIDRFVEIPGDTIRILGFNHIVSFELEEFSRDTLLTAAIANDSLIVYWPVFRERPTTIAPDIIVAEGATISPASGESVPFQTGTRYTVTAEDQTTQEYVLKVDIYQPNPVIKRPEDRLDAVPKPMGQTAIYNVSGDYFIPDTAETFLSLISWDSGVETTLQTLEVKTFRTNEVISEIPAELPYGHYRTKLTTGARTLERQDSVWVKLPNPAIFWPRSLSVSQGETFEIQGNNLVDLERLEFIGVQDATFEIVSFTETSIQLKVPEDFPTGTYSFVSILIYSPWALQGSSKFVSSFARSIEVTTGTPQ